MDQPVIPPELEKLEHFWCPMLGQPVRFGYCVRAHEAGPCPRIAQCWGAHRKAGELARILAGRARPGKGRLERVLAAAGREGDRE